MIKIMKLLFFLVFPFICFSQNMQVLYDFDEIPQTLLLNPGTNYSHDYFIGFPLLAGISIDGGATGLNMYDIFADDGRSINDKISDVIYGMDTKDSFIVNEKLDIFSVGLRLSENDFFSFGMYEEFDAVLYYPSDIVQLFYEGTTNLNKEYSVEGANLSAEILGVFHAGVTHKVNENLTIGGRLKLYSSLLNAQTKNNRGTFYTSTGTINFYQHHLVNFDATIQTSGLIYKDEDDFEPSDFTRKMFSFQNPGIGFDLGFTHQFSEQLYVTGSILDIGIVKNSEDVYSYNIRGDYDTEGVELEFSPDVRQDYWRDFVEDLWSKLPLDTLHTSYNSFRPIKLNASVKYSFGKPYYEDCFESSTDDPYLNSIGFQLYTIKRPLVQMFDATLFYERRFGSMLRTKLTYSIDSYSYSNIGLGLSTKFGPVNLYVLADNLLYLQNIAKANNASFQFGINFIFDKKFP
tara:strand:+ start:4724 stop:6106 length:1383 start_codon:yes stop_codon:yes gene_type:complete